MMAIICIYLVGQGERDIVCVRLPLSSAAIIITSNTLLLLLLLLLSCHSTKKIVTQSQTLFFFFPSLFACNFRAVDNNISPPPPTTAAIPNWRNLPHPFFSHSAPFFFFIVRRRTHIQFKYVNLFGWKNNIFFFTYQCATRVAQDDKDGGRLGGRELKKKWNVIKEFSALHSKRLSTQLLTEEFQ
jgi:hypothetical protein